MSTIDWRHILNAPSLTLVETNISLTLSTGSKRSLGIVIESAPYTLPVSVSSDNLNASAEHQPQPQPHVQTDGQQTQVPIDVQQCVQSALEGERHFIRECDPSGAVAIDAQLAVGDEILQVLLLLFIASFLTNSTSLHPTTL